MARRAISLACPFYGVDLVSLLNHQPPAFIAEADAAVAFKRNNDLRGCHETAVKLLRTTLLGSRVDASARRGTTREANCLTETHPAAAPSNHRR